MPSVILIFMMSPFVNYEAFTVLTVLIHGTITFSTFLSVRSSQINVLLKAFGSFPSGYNSMRTSSF